MLKVHSIYFNHNDEFEIEDISFELPQGDVLGVIGESGCGKTTILDLIYGQYDLTKGSISWDSHLIKGPSRQLIAGHEDFKYVTQDSDLMPYISVLDNIVKPLSRQYHKENITKAEKLLEVVSLLDFKHKLVKDLSGGQKQRVAIAKALAKTPKLLLLDEPFSHIDNFLKHMLRRHLFMYLKKINCACIIATHDYNDILPFSNQIMVLKHGKLVTKGSPKQLYNKNYGSYTAGLLSIYNTVEAKYIDKSLKGKIIVYPHEIELIENNSNEVNITEIYFHGPFYRIYLNWKGIELVCDSTIKPKTSNNYKVNIKSSFVLSRLHH